MWLCSQKNLFTKKRQETNPTGHTLLTSAIEAAQFLVYCEGSSLLACHFQWHPCSATVK